VAAVADPEKQLAWEARQRPRAGVASIVAGVGTLGGFIWSAAAFRDLPHSGFLTSLGQAFQPGPVGDQPSLRTPEFEFYDGKAFTFIGSSVVRAIAYVALAYAVTFLIVATRARRPELPRFIVYITLVGAVLSAVASVFGGVGTVLAVQNFLDGPRTVDAASDVATDSLLYTANLIAVLAPLLVAAGLLMVSLNAMRVGLLTRFLGILGMLSAALAILSQFLFSFVLTFWLISLGLLYLNLGPGGAPPAWRTGSAEPWPSQREVAEARRAGKAPRGGTAPAPQAESEPERGPAGTRPQPASRKRKRKRR
jgi:hypothetical protein